MAYTVDQAFFFVICNGVRCDSDECELVGNGCAFGRTDKKILAGDMRNAKKHQGWKNVCK